jgi:uncharacterized membrane protein YagU involved in acid resistance
MNGRHSVVFEVHFDSVLVWGFSAALLVAVVMGTSQALGWSRMSLPFLLGTFATANRDRALTIGLVLQVLVGWVLAFPYALIFESVDYANVWLGGAIGLLHGLFLLVVVAPLLPAFHPRMAREREGPTSRRILEPPGFFGLHYGHATPLVTLVAHVAYGVVLGTFYRSVGS